jgi:hypothetical protein
MVGACAGVQEGKPQRLIHLGTMANESEGDVGFHN